MRALSAIGSELYVRWIVRFEVRECIIDTAWEMAYLTDNTAHDCLQVPFPRNPAIKQIRESSVEEETKGVEMVVVND